MGEQITYITIIYVYVMKQNIKVGASLMFSHGELKLFLVCVLGEGGGGAAKTSH
jgi:hypothetical protein